MRRVVLFALAASIGGGCDDVLWGQVAEVPTEEGYAGVQAIAEAQCFVCHSAGSVQGQLDLETDLHAALVGVTSSRAPDWVLVQPGEPESSLLYLKVIGEPPSGGGSDMPPGSGGIDPAAAAIIEDWILDGAPNQ